MPKYALWMCMSLSDLMCILKASASEQPPHYDSKDATVKRVLQTSVHHTDDSRLCHNASACKSAPHGAQRGLCKKASVGWRRYFGNNDMK